MKEKVSDFVYGGFGIVAVHLLVSSVVTLITGTTTSNLFFNGFFPVVLVFDGLMAITVIFCLTY